MISWFMQDWGLGDFRHGGLREELLICPPVLGRYPQAAQGRTPRAFSSLP